MYPLQNIVKPHDAILSCTHIREQYPLQAERRRRKASCWDKILAQGSNTYMKTRALTDLKKPEAV